MNPLHSKATSQKYLDEVLCGIDDSRKSVRINHKNNT